MACAPAGFGGYRSSSTKSCGGWGEAWLPWKWRFVTLSPCWQLGAFWVQLTTQQHSAAGVAVLHLCMSAPRAPGLQSHVVPAAQAEVQAALSGNGRLFLSRTSSASPFPPGVAAL